MKRRWKLVLGGLGAVAVSALAPIVYIESACTAPHAGLNPAAPYRSVMPGAAGRRPEARTWLTYPEWHIVYSADSFGRYLAANPPSGFGYWRQITGFWSGLCAVNRAANASPGGGDARVMLYTIGLSFAAEMLVKAAYENVFGRLTEWIGGWRSADDRHAARVQQSYGAFMHETPWYRFPFGEALSGLWATSEPDAHLRHWERRFALSLEYGGKAAYAGLIGWASGAALGRDELSLRFVARAAPEAVAAVDRRLRPVARLGGGMVVVEAPRYAQFTEVLLRLAAAQVELVEIAGNDDIFLTVLVPEGRGAPAGAVQLMDMELDDRPGWRRLGLAAKVPSLLPLLRAVRAGGGEIEHVYDY